MATEKCPICGGKIVLEYCDSCGFRVPNEENISSLYNYDPSDYPAEDENVMDYAPEFMVREAIPEVQAEEIYPQREVYKMPSVNDTEQNINPYTDNRQNNASPYTTNTNNFNNTQNDNPYAGFNPANDNRYMNNNIDNNSGGDFISLLGSFIKDAWWKIIITFFVPYAGFLFAYLYKKSAGVNSRHSSYAAFFLIGTIVFIFIRQFTGIGFSRLF